MAAFIACYTSATGSVGVPESSGQCPVTDESSNVVLVDNVGGGDAPGDPVKVLDTDGVTVIGVPWVAGAGKPTPFDPVGPSQYSSISRGRTGGV